MDYVNWNRGLFVASILIAIGGMAVVSARSRRDRLFAVAALVQGVVVTFAVSGAFHRRSELAAVAIALMLLTAIWCVWDADLSSVSPSQASSVPTADGQAENQPGLPEHGSARPRNSDSEGA